MNRNILLLLLIIIPATFVRSQSLEPDHIESIKRFISFIKDNHPDSIAADMYYFPFEREYPIPPIKDSADFIKRYSEMFDTDFVNTIIKSDVDKDWSLVGWRGIMFLRGDLWLDEGGRLTVVNHESQYETDLRQKLINAERVSLDSSIRNYAAPVCSLETKNYRIRIDAIEKHNYRYACWKKNTSIDSKPDLVIGDGKIEFDGSGGNHMYVFKSGEYRYEVSIIVMGEDDDPPALLSVFKKNELLINEPASFKIE